MSGTTEANLLVTQPEEMIPLRNGVDPSELATEKRPLRDIVDEIERQGKASDDRMLSAAMLMRELRSRFDAGEMGKGGSWLKWIEKEIKLSHSQLHLLDAIARAPDPRQELERQRERNRKRGKKHRAAKQAQAKSLEPERRDLIGWAREAPFEDVRRVARQVEQLDRRRERVGDVQDAVNPANTPGLLPKGTSQPTSRTGGANHVGSQDNDR